MLSLFEAAWSHMPGATTCFIILVLIVAAVIVIIGLSAIKKGRSQDVPQILHELFGWMSWRKPK
ncbi:hypothetical protein AB0M95_13145 [Sphaerisporangium sp. NPDC051017]|uniref:hypothetical protein n=1 Tax=Sphaerisporangium sp. NPDC051017 TaxID=3154636 RepID=UPI003436F346